MCKIGQANGQYLIVTFLGTSIDNDIQHIRISNSEIHKERKEKIETLYMNWVLGPGVSWQNKKEEKWWRRGRTSSSRGGGRVVEVEEEGGGRARFPLGKLNIIQYSIVVWA